jgi:dihydroorotate dehydrogenase electron transfer subunit
LIEALQKSKKKVTVIQGAKTKTSLLYVGRFKDVDFCTDDGSFGFSGFTTSLLEKKLADKKFDVVYVCGPEIMMKKIFEITEKNKILCQASLERYMRCGFGICGACVCGKERVCIDGPVFSSDKLRTMDDFGKSAQIKSGTEVSLSEYFSWRCA